ncbi:MAG: NAD(P)H-dependent oxidoreductase subunit E [Clostridiales bacterium]|jgi:NADH:ubiquinone oxidoreductase subunit E|nr:NAD(P)H-dependent oxidoreductase subunit E [Clostridiales bacterium]
MKENHPVLTPALVQEMDAIMTHYQHDASKLLEILLDIQRAVPLQYIPKAAAYYVAENMKLKITQVYDVVSFFSALHESPRAKHPIQVCSSIVCKVNQSDFVLDSLRDILGIGLNEVTYDHRFTIEEVPCFGACDRAPAIRVHDVVYGPLTSREQIADIIEHLE